MFVAGLAALLGMVSGSAWAGFTFVSPTGGFNDDEPSLTAILDSLYDLDNLMRIDDDVDQIWQNLDGGATVKAKHAAHQHEVGYLDDTPGFDSLTPVLSSLDTVTIGETPGQSDGLTLFRWAIKDTTPNPDVVWSSRPSDNSDGLDHMVTFRITGNAGKPLNVVGNYVIAWEDLPKNSSDKDYNDVVLEVGNVAPTPEPGSVVAIAGIALSGLVGWAWRRRKSVA
jgi:hypothetical protein